MKNILVGFIATATLLGAATLIALPAHATDISNNRGAIIKVNGTVTTINNNQGAIIKVNGNGRNVNDVVSGLKITDNRGAIIKIDNVCGTVDSSVDVLKNSGVIVKINSSNTPCEKTPEKPVNPVVTVEQPAATSTTTTETAAALPAELPKTGLESSAFVAAGLGVLTAAGTYIVRRLR
jgi:LPXTG-motif cell wall-anchored protein